MKIYDLKLDTVSDYICDEDKWPHPCCDVMVESDTLIDIARAIFNKDPENGYVDAYADIDPERRFVTSFHLFFKDDDGSQDDITIEVTDSADRVEYYKEFESQGGDEFKAFIQKTVDRIHCSVRAEYKGCLVDAVDDFLEEANVRIPSSDKEIRDDNIMDEDGIAETSARIYGTDYDILSTALADASGNGWTSVINDRLEALKKYAEAYSPDELDFYTELKEEFTLDQIRAVCGDEFADHTAEFWENHGLV